jgi:hypothetical protein
MDRHKSLPFFAAFLWEGNWLSEGVAESKVTSEKANWSKMMASGTALNEKSQLKVKPASGELAWD